jgi:hypothetical protein
MPTVDSMTDDLVHACHGYACEQQAELSQWMHSHVQVLFPLKKVRHNILSFTHPFDYSI